MILDEPAAAPVAVEEIRSQAGLTPRERLRAELAAIDARLAELSRAAGQDSAWSIGDPDKLFGRQRGAAARLRMVRHVLSGRSTGAVVDLKEMTAEIIEFGRQERPEI